MISRTSLSRTSAPVLSTARRSCTLPGAASKVTDPPVGTPLAGAVFGERPRKYGEPSGAVAVTDIRAGVSPARATSPAVRGRGSHTKVTRVLPFSPRSVPSHVRTMREIGRAW